MPQTTVDNSTFTPAASFDSSGNLKIAMGNSFQTTNQGLLLVESREIAQLHHDLIALWVLGAVGICAWLLRWVADIRKPLLVCIVALALTAAACSNPAAPSCAPTAYRTAPNSEGVWQALNGLWFTCDGREVPDPNTGIIGE